jgi:hypothetical protein
VTTFIVTDMESACDSKWSDEQGNEIASELQKYLYIPDPDILSESNTPVMLYYSGDAEAIVLHQSYMVDALGSDKYLAYMENLKVRKPHLSFVEIRLTPWDLSKQEAVDTDQGVVTGGSGKRFARKGYFQHYCVKKAVETAVDNDERTGLPIVHLSKQEPEESNALELTQEVYDTITNHANDLIVDLQANEGVRMTNFKYAGTSTSSESEAPEVDIEKLKKYVKNREAGRWVKRDSSSGHFTNVKHALVNSCKNASRDEKSGKFEESEKSGKSEKTDKGNKKLKARAIG